MEPISAGVMPVTALSHVRSNKVAEYFCCAVLIGVADIVNVASGVINRVYKLQPSSEEQRSQCLRVDANNNVPEEEPLDNLTYAKKILPCGGERRQGQPYIGPFHVMGASGPTASGRTSET